MIAYKEMGLVNKILYNKKIGIILSILQLVITALFF